MRIEVEFLVESAAAAGGCENPSIFNRGRRRVRVYAYVFGSFVFVQHPLSRGFWVRTDIAVIKADCDRCGAALGEPCRNARGTGWGASTHTVRRRAAKTKEALLIVSPAAVQLPKKVGAT